MTLALHGRAPVVSRELTPFRAIGEAERLAADRVLRSGRLSSYLGAAGPGFMGGEEVRAFESAAAELFGVRHALGVNSWTSGLVACVGAIGLEPGDEIITSPWTMAATATSVLQWAGIPVFADIDPVTYNIDPRSVEERISPRTRAILAVDIFGLSADVEALRAIADRHGLLLIGDTAQAPGARAGDGFAGTRYDIGGFSLNYHKHIHCGEGGIVVTDDDRLAERVALIRNHAEVVTTSEDPAELNGLLGYNFRMGEIEAAIAREQLGRLAERVADRQRVARTLDEGLAGIAGIRTPEIPDGHTHAYYVYGMQLDLDAWGCSRERVLEALRAEGVEGLFAGYQTLHRLPLFRHRVAYGTGGFPWTAGDREVPYGDGVCPVAERLHDETFLGFNMCMYALPEDELAQVVEAFRVTWDHRDALAG
ncbi:MAG: DegT/DnrJ/EryC1/StrS family aminotransferase [Planctomycetota bacterium]